MSTPLLHMSTPLLEAISALWRATWVQWHLDTVTRQAINFPPPMEDVCIEAGVILSNCLQVVDDVGRQYPVEALERVQTLLDTLGMRKLGIHAKGAVEVIRAQDGVHWIEFKVRKPKWGWRLLNEINQSCLQYELSK